MIIRECNVRTNKCDFVVIMNTYIEHMIHLYVMYNFIIMFLTFFGRYYLGYIVIKLLVAWWLSVPWWHHQMETFSALLAICAGNSPVTGEFHAQRPVTRSFDVFFDLRPNKRLSKQWWGWWFEMVSSPLWRHCNVPSPWWRKSLLHRR